MGTEIIFEEVICPECALEFSCKKAFLDMKRARTSYRTIMCPAGHAFVMEKSPEQLDQEKMAQKIAEIQKQADQEKKKLNKESSDLRDEVARLKINENVYFDQVKEQTEYIALLEGQVYLIGGKSALMIFLLRLRNMLFLQRKRRKC